MQYSTTCTITAESAIITCPNVMILKHEDYKLTIKFSILQSAECENENTCNENFEWITLIHFGEQYDYTLTTVGERMLPKKTYEDVEPVYQSSFFPLQSVPKFNQL